MVETVYDLCQPSMFATSTFTAKTGPVFSSPWAIYPRVKVINQSVKVIKTKSEAKPSYNPPRGALGKRPSITAYCSSCACATFSVSLISSNSNFISS